MVRMRRYKLLYYIYKKGRIRDKPGLMAELRRLFGYSSDGHFYYDFNLLLREKLVEKRGDSYIITARGKREFWHIKIMQLSSCLHIAFGIILFLIYFSVLPL